MPIKQKEAKRMKQIDPDKLVKVLDRAIKFWTSARADPRGGDAVHLALREIRLAIRDSVKIPKP